MRRPVSDEDVLRVLRQRPDGQLLHKTKNILNADRSRRDGKISFYRMRSELERMARAGKVKKVAAHYEWQIWKATA